jgi:hypothetical protein
MYCEIVAKHGNSITAAQLEGAIRAQFGNDVPLATAYGRSAIYKSFPPTSSLFAFEIMLNCFVIVRRVNVRFSTFHLEGNTAAVSVETMLQAAQDFSHELVSVLKTSNYKATSLTVQLFEDNGRESGMQGKLVSWGSVFREKFSFKELKSAILPFITAVLLIWLKLNQAPLKSSVYAFVIVLVFTLADAIAGGWTSRGKIVWKLRQT